MIPLLLGRAAGSSHRGHDEYPAAAPDTGRGISFWKFAATHAAGAGELFRSAKEKADMRSDDSTGPRYRPWLRFAVTAALITAVFGPLLAFLDWLAIQRVQWLLPGPPSEPLGWGWAFGIAGAAGLALAARAEWQLRRGGRRLAAPDAEPDASADGGRDTGSS